MPYCSIDEAWSQNFPDTSMNNIQGEQVEKTCRPIPNHVSSQGPSPYRRGSESERTRGKRTYNRQEGHSGPETRLPSSSHGPMDSSVVYNLDPDYVPEPFPRPTSAMQDRGQMPGYMSANNLSHSDLQSQQSGIVLQSNHLNDSFYSIPKSQVYLNDSYYGMPSPQVQRETFQDFQGYQPIQTTDLSWKVRMDALEMENKKLAQLVKKYQYILDEHEDSNSISRDIRKRQPMKRTNDGLTDLAIFILSGVLVIYMMENIRSL